MKRLPLYDFGGFITRHLLRTGLSLGLLGAPRRLERPIRNFDKLATIEVNGKRFRSPQNINEFAINLGGRLRWEEARSREDDGWPRKLGECFQSYLSSSNKWPSRGMNGLHVSGQESGDKYVRIERVYEYIAVH